MSNNIHEQSWNDASQLKIALGHILGKIEPLFHRIEAKEVIEKTNEQIK